ncbi:MAG: glycosyltransferase family 4 protein [Pseudomonadales bacterium]
MHNDSSLALKSTASVAEVVELPLAVQLKPLKICLLGYRSHPFSGGQGIYIKYLSKALVDAGHEVDVISGQPYPEVDPRVRLIKLSSLNLYENGLFSLRPRHLSSMSNVIEWMSKLTGGFAEPQTFGRRVVKYLKQHGRDYDIIHDNQCLSFGMLKLQKLGFPLVTTVHHPVTQDLDLALNAATGLRQRALIQRWHSFVYMQRYVIQRLKHLVTVSEGSRGDIAKAFDLQPSSIDLVYCGIDTEEFIPRPDITRLPMRIMATASADQPLKGLRYLLEAVHQLAPRYPELELLVVGKPKAGGDTEKLIERLNIADRLTFVSGISTEELVQHYARATIAVVPSLYEGFGLPAGEAMSCGVPLVSTSAGALPEVVGDAGIQVEPGNADALAAAIDELLTNEALRDSLGQAGRERIEQKFCWHLAAEQMVKFYQRVLVS